MPAEPYLAEVLEVVAAPHVSLVPGRGGVSEHHGQVLDAHVLAKQTLPPFGEAVISGRKPSIYVALVASALAKDQRGTVGIRAPIWA